MESMKTSERSIRSVSEALVIASGAMTTAFGIALAAHVMYGAVQFAISFVAA